MLDEYGLPACGTKEQKRLRDIAMRKFNNAIKIDNKKRLLANELRFYRQNSTITDKELRKLEYLESQGF